MKTNCFFLGWSLSMAFVAGACGEGNVSTGGIFQEDQAASVYDGSPRLDYSRTYLLLPANVDTQQLRDLVETIWDIGKDVPLTFGSSLDDAGLGDLSERRIVSLDPDSRGGDAALRLFYTTYYPGVQYASLSPWTTVGGVKIVSSFYLRKDIENLLQDPSQFTTCGVDAKRDRGKPRKPYDRSYVLLHPSMDKEWASAVYSAGWERNQLTMGTNPDDAGLGALSMRRVYVVKPSMWSDWENALGLKAFFETYYPYHEFFAVNVNSPEGLSGYLYPDVSGLEESPTEHWVDVDRANNRLIAYTGTTPVIETVVRTGGYATQTPLGFHKVWTKLAFTSMGCVAGYNYCLYSVPMVQYFTQQGHALHAATATNDPDWNGLLGEPGNLWGTWGTHGCVNIPKPYDKLVYNHGWVGMRVRIHDSEIPDDNATYVRDVNIPDGTTFEPGDSFEKAWQLSNSGSFSWGRDAGYSFREVQNQIYCPNPVDMSSVHEIRLESMLQKTAASPAEILPGEEFTWSVPMTAPTKPGVYRSCWQMHRAGAPFGELVYLEIIVD